jgi:hypothetical protein
VFVPTWILPGFRSRKVSEGQTWNSENIRLYSFTVFFGPWQAVLTEVGYISKAPMCAGRLEAVTHWVRYGRFVPRLSGNSYCGIRVLWSRFVGTITVHFPHLAMDAPLQVCSIAQIRNHSKN